MGELITVLCLVVGELLGDATFFFMGARNHKKEMGVNEEKRRQYYITKNSWIIALLACIPGGVVKLLFWLLSHFFSAYAEVWKLLPDIAGVVDRFASIAVYMTAYRKIRGDWKEKFHREIIDQWGTEEDSYGIYVKDELSGSYILSEKWLYIKDCTRFLLVINFTLLALFHLTSGIRGMTGNILNFSILELIPIMASTVLMEFYNYLSFDDRTFFRGRRREAEAEELPLDIAQLKVEYEKKNIPGISTPLRIKRHDNRIEDAMQDYTKKIGSDENPYIQYFVDYLEKHRWSVKRHYHTGSLEAVVRLIKGENLFCASPFYKDIDICIFFPAFLTLLKGMKVLILAEDCGNLNELMQWVKAGIEEVQSLNDYWQVNILKETEDDADVGILSFQDIYRPEDFRWLKFFFDKVGFVVVIEASGMLSGGQEAISNLSSRIGKTSEECIWLLCDNNAESMLDLFSHLLNKNFAYVSATPLPAEESLIGYWNVEEEQKYPWTPVRHYLGAELQVAEVAWYNGVKQVILYGEEMVPIYDLKWIAGQYYLEFHKRTKRKPHQYIMNDGISMEISGNDCKMKKNCFLIVEDCNFNLYETARQYVTRASEKVVLHILSPNYMLRNFMKSNEDVVDADPKYIAQFVPEYVNTKRNIAVHLIRKMLQYPVAETTVREELEKSEAWGQDFNGLEDIKELIRLVVPVEHFGERDLMIFYGRHFDKEEGITTQEKYYYINSSSIKNHFNRYFQKACYIAENGEKCHINKLILAGHLDQKYLKGQLVVFNGLYYEIVKRRITSYEYILQVRRASEQILGRRYYRQDRYYELKKVEDYPYTPMDCQVKSLSVSSYTADISVKTRGYYVCRGWNEIADAAYIVLNEEDVRPRSYISKQFLKVKITIENLEEAKAVAVQMACLFQESFCTLYPQQYHLLSVAVDREKYIEKEDEEILKGVLSDIKIEEQEEEVCFYIIEDSMEDMGLLRSIERNFRRIQALLSEYMQWNEKSGDEYLAFGKNIAG